MDSLIRDSNVSIVKFLAIIAAVVVIYHVCKPRRRIATEPQLIPSWIPYIGHPLGIFVNGGRYLRDIR